MRKRWILYWTRRRSEQPYKFRHWHRECDYCSLNLIIKVRWTICADGKPDAATCARHIGKGVIDVTGRHPDAVLEIRPHQVIGDGIWLKGELTGAAAGCPASVRSGQPA